MLKLQLSDGELNLPTGEKEAAKFLADIMVSRGRVPDEDRTIQWKDMYKYISPKLNDTISTTEIRPLLKSATQIILRQPLDPIMVITPVFTEVMAQGIETKVIAGAIGNSLYAADVAEGGTLPENNFQIGNGYQTAYVGKSGIQASFTDEALRYSTWDIWVMNLQMMRAALVRHKERKAVRFLLNLGTVLFDNADPTNSHFGVCTGRGLDMQGNGSLSVDDLFKGLAHAQDKGYPIDTLYVNPLMYLMFTQDIVFRNMLLTYGGGSYFQSWSGVNGPKDPWSNGIVGGLGVSQGNNIVPMGNVSGATPTGIEGREHGMTATFQIPGYASQGLRVIASPFIPFDAETMVGDIIGVSSGNVGYFLRDQDLTQVEWRDEDQGLTKIRLMERYGFGLAYEGMGVNLWKNVSIKRNYWDGTIKATTMDVVSEIEPDADVLS